MSDHRLSKADLRHSLVAIYAAAAAFGFMLGLSSPLLSLILESRNVGSSMIGLNGAITSLGFLASAPLIPILVRRLGVIRVITTSVIISTTSLLLLRAIDDLAIWFVLRFMLGAAISGLLLISETWINQIADPSGRGRTIGIYVTVITAAFAAGPMIIPLTGIDSWTPFIIGILAIVISGVAFLPVRKIAPKFEDRQSVALFSFFSIAPILMAAVAVVALIDGAVIVHLAIYGLRLETGLTVSTAMVSAFLIGNIVLQIPIGWLADKLNGYRVLAICSVAGVLCSMAVVIFAPNHNVILLFLMILGGFTYGLYTIALTLLGERFSGSNLVAANAAFAIMWGVGGLAGPVAGGIAMDMLGPQGLPLTIVVVCGLFLILLVSRHTEVIPGLNYILTKTSHR